jgi:hypothetical protein
MSAPIGWVYGAMYDPDTTQKLGTMSTGIGGAINSVYGPGWKPALNPALTGNGIAIARIGAAPPYGVAAKSSDFTAAVVTFRQNSSATGIRAGNPMPSGGLNKSLKTCPPGGFVFAVL